MNDLLVQFLFGWPAILIVILLSFAGAGLKRPVLLIAAGIVSVPFTYYLSNGFRTPLLVLPVCELAAAYALMRGFNKIAWLWIVPLLITAALLAYTVITQ